MKQVNIERKAFKGEGIFHSDRLHVVDKEIYLETEWQAYESQTKARRSKKAGRTTEGSEQPRIG